MTLVLDHLVVAAADLDSGTRHVADLLGIAPAGATVSYTHLTLPTNREV